MQQGTHWGVTNIGTAVKFDHNPGEGRKVAFRVCVQVDHQPDPCSSDNDGR